MEERQPISMGSIVGNKVLIQLHREAFDLLELQGVQGAQFVAKVAGIDAFGAWIENPNYCTVPVYGDDGQYIAPEDRKEVCDRAVLLVQWAYIQTIMQFPDRASYMASPEETGIGFRPHVRPVNVQPSELVPIGAPAVDSGGTPPVLGSANTGKGKGKKGSKRG